MLITTTSVALWPICLGAEAVGLRSGVTSILDSFSTFSGYGFLGFRAMGFLLKPIRSSIRSVLKLLFGLAFYVFCGDGRSFFRGTTSAFLGTTTSAFFKVLIGSFGGDTSTALRGDVALGEEMGLGGDGSIFLDVAIDFGGETTAYLGGEI